MRRILFLLALALIVFSQPSHAIPINEFLRWAPIEQRAYAAGAVNMLAFTEMLNHRDARTNCITGWYRARGADQLFAALKLSPAAFKSRFGYDRSDESLAHVELVLTRLANDACPE